MKGDHRKITSYWPVILLILLGSLSWALTMVKSGLATQWGIGYWGANGHDGIWHLALIESIGHGLPIQNPLASGTFISNYHWGFDLILAILGKLSGISSSILYFQIAPPVLALSVGLSTYLLVRQWTGSLSASLWALFFTYFGGSFGWLITFVRDRQFGGESIFWSQQAISTLINPPYALSLVFLTIGFWLILRHPKPRPKMFVLQILVFSPLFIIKSYSAVIALAGLFVAGSSEWLSQKSWVGLIRSFIILLVTLVVMLTTSPHASGLIQFQPLWFTHTMIEAGDRLYVPKLILARQAYSAYHMYPRLVALEALLVLIFVVGNLGSRILAFFWAKDLISRFKRASGFEWALAAMFLTAVILPLLFTQSGTTWNTIQFFYYAQVFSGWLAGIWLSRLRLNRVLMSFLFTTVIVLTLPTTFSSLWYNYLPPRPPAVLPNPEAPALAFLKLQPAGTVLTYPYEKPKVGEVVPPPVPLFRYDSTAYVSAYSAKPSYLADTVNLSILNVDPGERLKNSSSFFEGDTPLAANRFLRDNYISYIYLLTGQPLPGSEGQLGVKQIFANSAVSIYRIL